MLKKVVIIFRAAANAGKTTIAEYIRDLYDSSTASSEKDCVTCCADDFFTDEDGSYKWEPSKINEAHNQCKKKFELALNDGVGLIQVANTSTTEKEYSFYLEKARDAGYIVFSLVVERRHGGQNNHAVPDFARERQAQNIKQSLKLL